MKKNNKLVRDLYYIVNYSNANDLIEKFESIIHINLIYEDTYENFVKKQKEKLEG